MDATGWDGAGTPNKLSPVALLADAKERPFGAPTILVGLGSLSPVVMIGGFKMIGNFWLLEGSWLAVRRSWFPGAAVVTLLLLLEWRTDG